MREAQATSVGSVEPLTQVLQLPKCSTAGTARPGSSTAQRGPARACQGCTALKPNTPINKSSFTPPAPIFRTERRRSGHSFPSAACVTPQPSPKSFVLALDPPFHSLRRRSQGSHQSWAASQKSSQSHPGSPCARRARVAERKGKGQLVMRRTRSQRAHSNKPPLNKSGFSIIS